MANSPEPKPEEGASVFANQRALNHLFSEYERARAERDAADVRLARFAETIKLLINNLPPQDRNEFNRRFEEIRSGTQHRGGEVFGNVIALFKRDPRKEWTVPEVQSALEKSGGPTDPKAIANAMNYLTKTGRLQRVARGLYVMLDAGAGLVDPDGPEDGIMKLTEH